MNATPDLDNKFHSICDQVFEGMDRLPIPGVVVGVLLHDQEWIAGLGVTSVEHPLPVTGATLFQVGSITKTFTATAIMRLVEMGKLDLDEPVRRVLPELKLADESVAERVTLRHLLTHTGGWVGDYFNDFGPCDDALARMVAELAKLEQLTPLGEVWSYNNAGFNIAGRVVEVATGRPYEQALHDLVLDPLGLKNTYFFAEDVITHRFAAGHTVVDRQPKVARPGRSAAPPTRSAASSAQRAIYSAMPASTWAMARPRPANACSPRRALGRCRRRISPPPGSIRWVWDG